MITSIMISKTLMMVHRRPLEIAIHQSLLLPPLENDSRFIHTVPKQFWPTRSHGRDNLHWKASARDEPIVQIPAKDAKPLNIRLCDMFAVSLA